jgi:hypothetical protein
MSVLTIIQNVAASANIPVPSAVVSSTDASTMQLLRLFYKEGQALRRSIDWVLLLETETFVASASIDQGIPTDFFRMTKTPEIWNDSTNLPLIGPVSARDWTALNAVTVSTLSQYWRFQSNNLQIYPPRNGDTIRFDYIKANWIDNGLQEDADEDDDNVLFPEELMELGILWRWKQAKGLDYAEEMRDYELAKMAFTVQQEGGGKSYNVGSGRGDVASLQGLRRTWQGRVIPV